MPVREQAPRNRAPGDFEMVRAVLARRRRLGESFEQAWPLALSVLDRPTSTGTEAADLEATLGALEKTREDWRLAFERLPPREPPYRPVPFVWPREMVEA